MICISCKKDYRDVPPGRPPGHFYRSDDHFYKDYRRFGMQCTNCGFVAAMITKATGDPYRKREEKEDFNQIDIFDEMEESKSCTAIVPQKKKKQKGKQKC